MIHPLHLLSVLILCTVSILPAHADLIPAEEGTSAKQIADRAENALRSDRTILEAQMTVISPRITRPRVMQFTSWDDRENDRSFIRMMSPVKDKGTSFLKVHPNLWMYIPRVERTMRIPPSMMMPSWMGSDFSNDDIVNDSSETDDYTHKLLGIETKVEGHDGRAAYVLEYNPKEDAPVVWGKIISWIDVERGV
ncbi:outer membrane lipoprotein-sorting protein, partial [Myxococcota bacterium]|nr:outer membrane lipoprotein-sorting protein [Myxococcota bacterium]